MPWAGELSDEELSIIKAAFQTIQVQGTPVMRKVVALEDRLKEAAKPSEKEP